MTPEGVLEQEVSCPYCGEPSIILVDGSVPEQDYIEDCQVCCRPMVVSARLESDASCRVDVRREDDA